MSNILKITVDNPDDLLNAGAYAAGAVIRVQTAATQAGAFADVAGTGSTPTLPLVAATYLYTGFDPTGASTSWYRTRFENAGATRLSDWSTAFQVGGETAGGLCTLGSVKRRLGIAPTDTADDDQIALLILEVTSLVEQRTARTFTRDPIGSGTKTYLYDGHGAIENGQCLLIPRGIQSITTLQVATNTGGTLQTVPSTDYFLAPNDQERDPGWPYLELWMTDYPSTGNPAPTFYPGYANISVTGVFGWPSTPYVISELAKTTVVRAWIGRQSGQTDTVGSDVLGRPIISRFLSGRDADTLASFRAKTVSIV